MAKKATTDACVVPKTSTAPAYADRSSVTDAAQAMASTETYPNVVIIDLCDAEHLLELFSNVEVADAHFHNCQAHNFRQHVQSVYKANNVCTAFTNLKAAIEAAKGE